MVLDDRFTCTYVHAYCVHVHVRIYVRTCMCMYTRTYVHACTVNLTRCTYSHLLNCSSKKVTGVLNSQVAEIKRCQNQRVSFDWDGCEYVALERMYE